MGWREDRVSGVATIPATAALLVLCMGLWATALLPEVVTALAFFGLAMLLRLGSSATVFSGFSASAFWLVLSLTSHTQLHWCLIKTGVWVPC